MFRFLMLIAFLFIINMSWPLIEKQFGSNEIVKSIDLIQTEINELKDNPEVLAAFDAAFDGIQQLLAQLDVQLGDLPETKQNIEPKEKVELDTPANQTFAIYNVEIGDEKADIEHNLGTAKRSSSNEYGTDWNAYHENYQEFFMVMYDENNKAAGLFTNQDLIASTNGIKLGTPKETVRAKLGEPITQIQKGLMVYQFEENKDYDVFLLDDVYITIFYDKHEGDTVTAMQLISKDLEQKKTGFYTKASADLKEGFEYQLFDLTNAARVKHQLPVLTWDQHVRETARKHSSDMAVNDYFNHNNLDGETPFDRMKEDNIRFQLAGENLAYGQFSSIFAHEGLMNSLGHRKNILKEDYEFLGVGVAFNDESHPYYTQNFYAK